METQELLKSYDLELIAARINGTNNLLDEIARLNRNGIGNPKVEAMRVELTQERDALLDRYMFVSDSETDETNEHEHWKAELAKLDPNDPDDQAEIAWIQETLAEPIGALID